ncbi:hypothetical protein HMI56_006897 [Coelomomyces lativittatus]|nr:hypothetical protein HMI56_006897 [Coelomomyces lativittatus]
MVEPSSLSDLKIIPTSTTQSTLFEDVINNAYSKLNVHSTKFTLMNYPLSSLPEDFFKFHLHLELLDLRGNFLNQLPNSFFQLIGLKVLYLGENCFESLPVEMETFKKLEFLDLSENKFKTLNDASWLSHLISLQVLDLRGNQLTSLPTHLGFLINLKVLLIDRNPWESYSKCLTYPLQLKKRLVSHRLIYKPEDLNGHITRTSVPTSLPFQNDEKKTPLTLTVLNRDFTTPKSLSKDSGLLLSDSPGDDSLNSISKFADTSTSFFNHSYPESITPILYPSYSMRIKNPSFSGKSLSNFSGSYMSSARNGWRDSSRDSSQNFPSTFSVTSPIRNKYQSNPIILSEKKMYKGSIYLNAQYRVNTETENAPSLQLYFLNPNLTKGVLHYEKLAFLENYRTSLYATLWFLRDLSDINENWLLTDPSILDVCSVNSSNMEFHSYRRASAPAIPDISISALHLSDSPLSQTRKNLFKELIKTEITYVAEMAFAIENYCLPFLNKKLLNEEDCDLIFGNYKEILNFHKSLFFEYLPLKLENLGQYFTTYQSYLELYTRYTINYERASRIFRGWVSTRKNLKKFLDVCFLLIFPKFHHFQKKAICCSKHIL